MHAKSNRRKRRKQQAVIHEEEFFVKRTTKGRATYLKRRIKTFQDKINALQKQLNNLTGRMVKVG